MNTPDLQNSGAFHQPSVSPTVMTRTFAPSTERISSRIGTLCGFSIWTSAAFAFAMNSSSSVATCARKVSKFAILSRVASTSWRIVLSIAHLVCSASSAADSIVRRLSIRSS